MTETTTSHETSASAAARRNTRGLGRLVRGYYEAVDTDDVDYIEALFAPDGVYERPGYPPLNGLEAIVHFFRETRAIRSGRHVVESLVEGETTVACRGRFKGTLRDGQNVELRWADFWRFDETGRVAHRISFFYTPMV